MKLRKGDIIYNQEIPENEKWEDTLKRNELEIFQVKDEDMLGNGTFDVECYIVKDGKLILKNTRKSVPKNENLVKENIFF